MQYRNYLGIDVSKGTLDCCLLQRGKKRFDCRITNDKQGLKQLHKELKSHVISMSETLVCLEKTGIYTYVSQKWMQKKGYHVWLENPLAIKKSMGIVRGKNDKIDAQRIALYAMRYQDIYEPLEPVSEEVQILQTLNRMRERLSETMNKLKIPLKESKSILPTKWQNRLESLCTDAFKGVEKSFKKVENEIKTHIAQSEELNTDFKRITSVQGVGPVVASGLLVVTNGFKRIKTANKMACYAGVAPFSNSSGTSIKGRNKVSHLANKRLKKLLHMAALSVIRLDGDLADYYHRKVAEGKHKMLVLNAIRSKIVHRVYACVHEKRKYEKNYTRTVA